MDRTSLERRLSPPMGEGMLKSALSDEQAETLRALERVGWLIRFVRKQPDGKALAGVYDPDNRMLAIIEPDGRLIENPPLSFRG